MPTLFQLMERAENDDKIESLVRRGLAMSSDVDHSVWDDVLSLFGQNRSEAAELFGVRPETISRGMGRLRKALTTVKDQAGLDKKRVRSSMLHTGI